MTSLVLCVNVALTVVLVVAMMVALMSLVWLVVYFVDFGCVVMMDMSLCALM